MGGVGKTALAIQYAYAYADYYPGGRWLVGCAGETSLASALRRLDLDLGLTLNDAEKRDDTLAARRVLAELERRAIEGATARSGEKDPPQPKALLLLDNVDHPALLQPPQSDLLTGRQWLHVLATTRSGAEDFGNDPETLMVLSIDELPDDDALRLIENYQPGGRFPNQQEREAALELVKLLGGFTLAVEVVAVHLGERAGRVTCAAFLERMRKEGFAGLEGAALATKAGIKHGEKLVGATLKPTLDLLSEQERLVLSYAALLPPDTIPFPWLRALAAKDFPELGRDAETGYDDPWLSLVNHLLGLRLLQTVDLAEDGRTPRILRMHRLVEELVRSTDQDSERHQNCLFAHAFERCRFLEEGWLDQHNRWEIGSLGALSQLRIDNRDWDHGPGPWLAGQVTRFWHDLGMYSCAESLCRRELIALERVLGPDHPETLRSMSNLAVFRDEIGDHMGGVRLCRRVFEACERVLGPEHPDTLESEIILASLLLGAREYTDAEPLCRRALDVCQRVLGPEHLVTLRSVNNLAALLENRGDYAGAERLYRRALEGRERVLGPEHPDTLTSVNFLAALLESKGDYAGAERLYRRALEGRERVLGPEHPETLGSLQQVASLLHRKGDLPAAEPLYRRVLETQKRILGPEHPHALGTTSKLAMLLAETGRAKEAIPLQQLSLEASERTLGIENPIVIQLLCVHAHGLRVAGLVAEAEPYDRRAATTSVVVLGEAHPLTLHRRNNLVLTLILLGKLDEAREILSQNAQANAPSHENLTPRIPLLQWVVELLAGRTSEATIFLGRLKTHFGHELLPVFDKIGVPWDISHFIDALQPKLGTQNTELLRALVAVLNARCTVPPSPDLPAMLAALDAFPAWREATPQPLD